MSILFLLTVVKSIYRGLAAVGLCNYGLHVNLLVSSYCGGCNSSRALWVMLLWFLTI
jgi:hypothetical protein